MIKLRSTIHSELKRFKLIRGTLLGGVGILWLAYFGSFLPLQVLEIWGLPIFFIGLGLILAGLLPYRQLNKLEIHPHEIVFDEANSLNMRLYGKSTWTLPSQAIERMAYISVDRSTYGIAIWLKDSMPEKIIVHDLRFKMCQFLEISQRKQGCDLFLPYFSKTSYQMCIAEFQTS